MSTNINMQEFDRQQAEVISSIYSNDDTTYMVDMDEFDRQQAEVSSSTYVKDAKSDDSMTEELAIANIGETVEVEETIDWDW